MPLSTSRPQGNYSSFRDTMIEQELYPDDTVPDLSNKDLCECIPFLKVSAVPCFRKACAGYWKHRLRLSKALRLNRHRRDSDANLPAWLAHDPPIRTFPSSICSLPSPVANTNTTSSMNSNPIMIVNTGTGSTNMSITSPPISTRVDPIFSTSLPIPNPLPPSPSNLQTRGDSSIEFSVGQKHPLPEPADDGWRRCERIYPEGGGYTLWYQYDQENQTWGDGEGGTAHSMQQNTDYLMNLQEQAGKEGCIDRMQNPDGSWTRMEPGRFNPISF
ncbi:hypothetical protein BS47DRAFT_29753 [Hydnum rufescens UP504]|uniref:Uncharacterized protein n=1 Tax=Hydnum rufescens UP504 TaxID=1448309 RepID=A0A9P6B8B6_9AGAM|nr:hypothetical protein BS47DRAFT_29753 [Hydnum rufescens UP504]